MKEDADVIIEIKELIGDYILNLKNKGITLYLEEGALKYKAQKGVLTGDILSGLKIRKTEVIDYLKLREEREGYEKPIDKIEEKEYYPLSAPQRRMFLINKIEGANISYNIAGAEVIEGKLDRNKLEDVFRALVKRHDALRTSFKMLQGQPVQKIHKSVDFNIEYYKAPETEIKELIKNFVRPFDLSKAPLLRVGIIEVSEGRHILLHDIHHIISDDASMKVLFHDFVRIYNGETLPELRIQYKDFSAWQEELKDSYLLKKQEEYWLERLKGEIPVLNLPIDFPKYGEKNIEGAVVNFEIGNELVKKLNRLSAQNGATLFMTMVAAYNVLLSKCTGQEDIIVGSPIAGRSHPDSRELMGVFLNTLVLRNFPEKKKTFSEFLKEVKENTYAAFENQEYPIEDLIEKLEVKRYTGRNPLFDVMINYLITEKTDTIEIAGGMKLKPYNIEETESKLDMSMYLFNNGTSIKGYLVYRTVLFKRETIEYIGSEFLKLLEEAVELPNKAIADFEIFNKASIEIKGNRIKPVNPYEHIEKSSIEQSIVQVFEKQVEKYKENIAVKTSKDSFTYDELNKRANKIAREIQREASETVALLFNHDAQMIEGIFGALKAGKIYVPLDPNYPKDRIAYMLKDSGAKVLITCTQNQTLAEELKDLADEDVRILNIEKIESTIDENLNIDISPEQPAYILYTSGSTGKPKGVIQNHRNVLHFIRNYINNLHINAEDRLTLFSSYSFDAAVMDIYGALLCGAALYPYSIKAETGKENQLCDWIQKEEITIFHSIPTVFRYFTDTLSENKEFPKLHLIVMGGEAVFKKDVEVYKKYFSEDCIFINGLGPTESTVTLQYFIDKNTDISNNSIPVGYPVEDTTVYLLTDGNKEAGVFETGEIVYKSEHLALGYWNLPEKTKEVFVKDPITGSGRVYRSGDLGRLLPDGSIEFMGRNDFQVKVRGYRIELGEIEAVIDNIEGVQKGLAAAFQDEAGENYLAAFYTVKEGAQIEEDTVQRTLQEKLPGFMVPACVTRLKELPKTPNGKLDRKSLPKPERSIKADTVYGEPRNAVEEKLVFMWQELLSLERVGVTEDFFNIGGHSLKAMTLIAKIHQTFSVEVQLKDIFAKPTIREIAELIEASKPSIYAAIEPVEEREYYPLSAAQKRMYILNRLQEDEISYNIHGMGILEGKLEKEKLENAFAKLIYRHESLRTSFHMIDGEVYQKIHKDTELNISYIKAEEENLLSVYHDFIKPFDLSKAPLLRVQLVEIEEDKSVLMYDMHHIISDGTSLGILVNEFMSLYSGETLLELRLQYKDYSIWQNNFLESDVMKKQEEYWLEAFRSEVPSLNFPLDYKRPELKNHEGELITFEADLNLTEKLNRFSAERGTTLYMVLLSAYNILLSKYTGQCDIVVGSPIAGRPHADLQNIIGIFINTLAMRNYPDNTKNFTEFLLEVKENALKAYENQEYQFEELLEKLKIKRDLNRNPLFDTMFILQNMDMGENSKGTISLKAINAENFSSKFDFTIRAFEGHGKIFFRLEYARSLFKKETMEKLAEHYINILNDVLEKPVKKLSEIDMLSDGEKQAIDKELNKIASKVVRDSYISIPQMIRNIRAENPEKTAIEFGSSRVSYRELDKKSSQIGDFLNAHVKAAKNVVIFMERSSDLVTSFIGVMKAGLVVVPIDPEFPEYRVTMMLEAVTPEWIITDASHQEKLVEILKLQDKKIDILLTDSQPECDAENIFGLGEELSKTAIQEKIINEECYIYFTSGSTGKPKGILGKHTSLKHFIEWEIKEFGVNGDFRISQFTTPSFDAFLRDVFVALCSGGTLCIPEDKYILLEPGRMAKWIEEKQITLVHMVPSLFRLMLNSMEEKRELRELKYIFLAGEMLRTSDIKLIKEATGRYIQMVNLYGPTETTMVKMFYPIKKEDMDKTGIPIGKPMDGTEILVLNEDMKKCSVGSLGEIYIRTPFATAGYYRDADLTSKVFIKNPYSDDPNDLIYKTGDIGRILPDGNLECMGRKDNQVKVRGIRIELGEIETQLLKQESIKEAVVVAREDMTGEKNLCAYFTADVEQKLYDIRDKLLKELPVYMVPTHFVQLEKMPLLPNGKTDRAALPEPKENLWDEREYEAPENEIQERLLRIWQKVLGLEQIDIRDNFFELGGHSLKATALASAIHKEFDTELPLREIFRTPTIKELAENIEKGKKSTFEAILPVEEREYYPLSAAQKRIFIISQIEFKDTKYNIPQMLMIKWNLDIEKMDKALKALVRRHEALRTSFELIDNEPVQIIHEDIEINIQYREADEVFINDIIKEFIRPFDLKKAPLLRAEIVKVGEDKHMMMFDIHHIISDGIALGILIRELFDLYSEKELPELKIQYKDYAVWHNAMSMGEYAKNQEEYWIDTFKGELPVLNMPLDFKRPAMQSFEGRTVRFELDKETSKELYKLTMDRGATLYMVLLGAYNVLLSKYTGQEDIVVGTPVAGRNHEALESLVGVFINTLAMRNYPNGEKKFGDFLDELKLNTLKAYENQDYQFETLVEKLAIKRDLSRNPLFDTMLILQNMDNVVIENENGLLAEGVSFQNGTSKYDMTLYGFEKDDIISFRLDYCTKLFLDDTINRFVQHFINVLKEIVKNPNMPIKDIDILSMKEKERLLVEFNATSLPYPKDTTIHDLFEAQAEKSPERQALIFGDAALSYRELNNKANILAGILREKGVAGDVLVGLKVKRSFEMIIGLLAVLKAGGAYVPIDPEYPKDRVQYMLEDSKAKVLLTDTDEADAEGMDVINIKAVKFDTSAGNPSNLSKAGNLAYVIYTSGSTGKPKGVMLEHKSVINFVEGIRARIDFSSDKKILALTTISFDIFVLEVIMPLILGNTIVIANENQQRDSYQLRELILKENIEMLQMTPSRMNLLLKADSDRSFLKNIKEIMIGGEAFPEVLLKELQNSCEARIYNMYGPTETTVWSAVKDLTAAEEINIGSPIANTKIYILNKDMNIQPIGVYGDLYIGGDGLARGYLFRSELTEERFVRLSPIDGERIYKTGDVARWLPNGELQFTGRIDNQLKVRGYRIELEEIEKVLLENQCIKECVVTAKSSDDGDNYLIAYYIKKDEITVSEMRAYLKKQLPEYMVPSFFIELDEIPLTPNGKVNRLALPEPDSSRPDLDVEYVAPENDIEKTIAQIWSEILKKDEIGVHDSFFELGGTSLLVVIMHSELVKHYKCNINIADIFVHNTVARLAAFINEKNEEIADSIDFTDIELPADYFMVGEAAENTGMNIVLEESISKGLRDLAKKYQISVEDVLLAGAVYLFADISQKESICIPVFTERNTVFPIDVNLNDISEFKELYDLVKANNQKMEGKNYISFFNAKRFKKLENTILPAFIACEADALETNSDISIQGKNTLGDIELIFKYKAELLNYKKMEELFRNYIKVVYSIVKEC